MDLVAALDDYDRAVRRLHARVDAGGNSATRVVTGHMHLRKANRQIAGDFFRLVGRAVVDDGDLELRTEFGRRLKRRRNARGKSRLAIEDRQQDRERFVQGGALLPGGRRGAYGAFGGIGRRCRAASVCRAGVALRRS